MLRPMGVDQAWAFVAFAAVAAITPGPSNVMLTATGSTVGIVRGLPCLAGVGAGMAALLLVVALGLGGLVLAYPLLLSAMKWSGAAFLLWLAWRIAASAPDAGPGGQQAVGFTGAFAFQWLNPKSWLVSTSAVGAFMAPGSGVLVQAFAFAGLFFVVASACGFAWLGAGVMLGRLLRRPRWRRAFNLLMGTLLAASVAWILR